MNLDSLIKSKVNMAFRLAGDMVDDVILNQKNITDYNFTTDVIEATDIAPVIIKGLVSTKQRKDNTTKTTLTLKSTDIVDASLYDTVTIRGVIWNIVMPVSNDGYLFVLEIARQT